jgi:hypothetical protein
LRLRFRASPKPRTGHGEHRSQQHSRSAVG